MDAMEILRAVLALLFVLALILLVAWLVRRFGLDRNWKPASGAKRRLEVMERMTIDPKRQVVLIRCDSREHLLVLGQNEVQVVASAGHTTTGQDDEQT